ncbi:MAG TPA: hypothetical protein VG733_08125 [Chthoniobacteraceae bacterium]|nr:hypothetical protein [Chthoniobacteraceae bacterium]
MIKIIRKFIVIVILANPLLMAQDDGWPFKFDPKDADRYAPVAKNKGLLDEYQLGTKIIEDLSNMKPADMDKFDIKSYRGVKVTFYGSTAPPGATNDLFTLRGYYIRVVNAHDLRPRAVAWDVLVSGTILQVIPQNKVIVLKVNDEDWKIVQTL